MDIPLDLAKQMVELDAKVRWFYTSPTYKENEFGKVVVDNTKPAMTFCEIIDKATGVSYVIETGMNDEDSLRKALTKARGTEKPKTKAQLSESMLKAEAAGAKAEVASRDEEIASLRAELEELKKLVQPAAAGGRKGRGSGVEQV